MQQAEPVGYDKTELNRFVQDLYDEKMQEGKHGHYETMFHVVHQAIKKVAPPKQQAEPVAQSDLVKRLRDTASKGVSVWGDLQMEAAREIEILTAERESYASAMDRMLEAQPEQRKPLTDEQKNAIVYVGPVYAPDGRVTRTPDVYRKEIEAHRLDAIRRTEAAHGIKEQS
jgi:hypothetical protein